jgi:hypothetical protein
MGVHSQLLGEVLEDRILFVSVYILASRQSLLQVVLQLQDFFIQG